MKSDMTEMREALFKSFKSLQAGDELDNARMDKLLRAASETTKSVVAEVKYNQSIGKGQRTIDFMEKK